jgi:hypothetical protein
MRSWHIELKGPVAKLWVYVIRVERVVWLSKSSAKQCLFV